MPRTKPYDVVFASISILNQFSMNARNVFVIIGIM